MSPRLPGPRLRLLLGGWFLLVLFLSSCATGIPMGGRMTGANYRYQPLTPPMPPKERVAPGAEPGLESATVYVADFMEPGAVRTRPVPIPKAEFQQAFLRLSRDVRLKQKAPREAAHDLLEVPLGAYQDVETIGMKGWWVLEAYRDETYSLLPLRQTGPEPLTPEADDA